MHFTRHSTYDTSPVPVIVRGEGARIFDQQRQELPRRALRALRRAGRPRPHRARRGRGRAGRRSSRSSRCGPTRTRGDRPRGAPGRLRPGRPQPGLLHHRRRRGRRDRLEAGQAVLQAHRQAEQAQGDLARRSRTTARRRGPVDHRHPDAQGAVRAAGARRAFKVPNTNLYRAPEHLRDDDEGVRPLGRRPHRARPSSSRGRHRRGGLPRAGAERRRLLPAAARLLRAGPRDLRRSTTCCWSATR